MVYLLKMVIFHGCVSHNQRVYIVFPPFQLMGPCHLRPPTPWPPRPAAHGAAGRALGEPCRRECVRHRCVVAMNFYYSIISIYNIIVAYLTNYGLPYNIL